MLEKDPNNRINSSDLKNQIETKKLHSNLDYILSILSINQSKKIIIFIILILDCLGLYLIFQNKIMNH